MSVVAELLYSRRVPQVAVLALISFRFAGCSADMSSRLSQSNFSNPVAAGQTGAVLTSMRARPDPSARLTQSHFPHPFSSDQTGSVQQAPPPQQRELPQ